MSTGAAIRIVKALSFLGLLICLRAGTAADDPPTEQALRAAMVFNFLKFAELPATGSPGDPRIRLCVAAGDPQQVQTLAALSGRQVRGRSLIVTRFGGRGDDCQVLYVDSRQRWVAAVESLASGRVLSISAYPGFVQDGGMIEIAIQDGAARFDINLAESRRAGVAFYPQLLRLARHVHE